MIEEKKYTELLQRMNSALSVRNPDKITEQSLVILSNPKNELSYAIKTHYNDIVYNLDNGGQGISKYLDSSLIREILQNIIDCNYTDNQIKIDIITNDNDSSITFKYNEDGFKISNLIAFFSLDHTSKNEDSTGAFGIGAKGAILSSKRTTIKSSYSKADAEAMDVNFEIGTVEQNGKYTLNIEKLEITDFDETTLNSGTEFCLFLNHTLYKDIKENLYDIDGEVSHKKGKYLNPFDLLFASLKKRGKPINISIDSELCLLESSEENVSFSYKSNETTFNVFESEESHFQYLIPHSFTKGVKPIFVSKFSYDYFSTYELTGRSGNQDLPQFYINIPTRDVRCSIGSDGEKFINNTRTGINPNKETTVENFIYQDTKSMLTLWGEKNSFYFDEEKRFSFTLLYFYKYIKYKEKQGHGNQWTKLKKDFAKSVAIKTTECGFLSLGDFKYYTYDKGIYEQVQNEMPNESNLILATQKNEKRSEYSKNYDFYHKYNILSAGVDFKHHKIINYKSTYRKDDINDDIIIDILSLFEYRNSSELLLLSAENDSIFTEATLLKLLKVITYCDIKCSYKVDEKMLVVGGREYRFMDGFKVANLEVLEKCSSIKKMEELYSLLKEKFLCNLFSKPIADVNVATKINEYNKAGLCFKYNYSNPRLIDVLLNNGVSIDKDIDVSSIMNVNNYNALTSIVGSANYKLLESLNADDILSINQSIVDAYPFDVDEINRICDIENADIINNIYLASSESNLGDKNLVATIKDDIIIKIVQFDEWKSPKLLEDSILAIIPANNNNRNNTLKITDVSKILDDVLRTDKKIYNFYKPVKKPVIKLIDQFSYKLKPIQSINKNEIDVLRAYLKSDPYLQKNDNHDKFMFTKDVNNKLYGYSGTCSLCGYTSEILNAFQVKDKFTYNSDTISYRITLYLCANHFFESEGWIISNILFWDGKNYSISFNEWLISIKENNCILANLLKCRIEIIRKSTYELFNFDEQESTQKSEIEKHNIILTPLMAIKWYVDNTR